MNVVWNALGNTPPWLRWVLIFPISVLVYVLTNVIFNVGGALLNFVGYSPYNEKLFTHLVSPYFAGYYCINISSNIAPSGKRITGFFLSAIWMAAYGAMAVAGMNADSWRGLLPAIFSTMGCLYAFNGFEVENHSTTEFIAQPSAEIKD